LEKQDIKVGMRGRRDNVKMDGDWGSLFGSPQRAQRPQRILLHWLCVLSVLCGAVFHKYYILTAAGSEQTQLPFRAPGPPDTHASTRLHKSACQPPHHRAGGADREGAAGEPFEGYL